MIGETSAAQSRPVEVWITSSDEAGVVAGLEEQPNLAFSADAKDATATIEINDKNVYQQMEGGGAAFTDAAAWLIGEKLSAVQREKVMHRLFDPIGGIGLSFLRNPIGSSDLTREWYTYDDDADDRSDASLPHFSIDRDLAHVIPLTKFARKLNPRLTLMVNAWSPPAWMKSSGSLVAGGVLPQYYAHHANYHVKTIQAYEAQGLHVDYVSLNNEPTCCKEINYPSILLITSSDMAAMLKDYWFPAFKSNHITTKILLLDFNWNRADLVEPLLKDDAIRSSPLVAGVAWHGYGGDVTVQSRLHNQYGVDQFFTERSGFGGGSRQQKQDMQDMVHVIRNWGKTFVKWPVAVDENNGPNRGGCDTCRGLVTVHTRDTRAGQVDYTIEYYTMGQLTKFVPNGSYRIDSTENPDILNVAFRDPNGSLILVAYNNTTTTQAFKVRWRSESFHYTLPVNTTATFRWTRDDR
jgi:glucosylceramidase